MAEKDFSSGISKRATKTLALGFMSFAFIMNQKLNKNSKKLNEICTQKSLNLNLNMLKKQSETIIFLCTFSSAVSVRESGLPSEERSSYDKFSIYPMLDKFESSY